MLRARKSLQKKNNNNNNNNNLQGFVPLYEGMPVILQFKNFSTDLGITNGAQGIIHNIHLMKPCDNFQHISCVIVEFPDSEIHLAGLSKGYFPVMPIKTTFTFQQKETLQITRSQIPLQPAFSITGHIAEGKLYLLSLLIYVREVLLHMLLHLELKKVTVYLLQKK